MTNITKADLIKVNMPSMPKGAYRGEFHDQNDKFVANIYVVNHRAVIADPKEYGNGEIAKIVPGDFDPKCFERCGGFQWTSSQYVSYWRIKPELIKEGSHA